MRLPPVPSVSLLRQSIDCNHFRRWDSTPLDTPMAAIISLNPLLPRNISRKISRHHLSPIWSNARLMELARVINLSIEFLSAAHGPALSRSNG